MWWDSLSTFQQVMFVIACATTLVLIIQIILMIISGAHDAGFDGAADGDVGDIGNASDISGDIDIDVDADIDVGGGGYQDVGIPVDEIGGGDIGVSSSDVGTASGDGSEVAGGKHSGGSTLPFGLRLLSLRSIIAFVAVGTWVGYTLGYVLDWYYALIIALVCGFAAACCMAAALAGLEKLQSNGTINPNNAVGKLATVYLTIPPRRSGSGKVNVLIQERYAEYEAITDSIDPLPTASEVIIKGHVGANVLLVAKHVKPSITIENDKN